MAAVRTVLFLPSVMNNDDGDRPLFLRKHTVVPLIVRALWAEEMVNGPTPVLCKWWDCECNVSGEAVVERYFCKMEDNVGMCFAGPMTQRDLDTTPGGLLCVWRSMAEIVGNDRPVRRFENVRIGGFVVQNGKGGLFIPLLVEGNEEGTQSFSGTGPGFCSMSPSIDSNLFQERCWLKTTVCVCKCEMM